MSYYTMTHLAAQLRHNDAWLERCENLHRREVMKISQDAREIRKAKCLSLRTVATRMGVSAAFLSDRELGNRKWSQKQFEAFQKAVEA